MVNVVEPIMQFFVVNDRLKPEQQAVAMQFYEVAQFMYQTLPRNAERSAGLRKLLEAKDCAVRASLPVQAETTEG